MPSTTSTTSTTSMTEYALLLLPSANRVYANAAVELTMAELEIFAEVLSEPLSGLAPATIAGVGYVTFSTDALTDRDLAFLANASAAYALYERRGDLLAPVELIRLDQFDDDLLTIQKYAGKTNEQFTKLLLNVTLLSRRDASTLLDGRLRVLDPLCGRGTTLNQVLTYGHDAAGIDLDGRDYEAYLGFLRTYLQRKKIKHKIEESPVRREHKVVARRMTVRIGDDRAASAQTLDVVNADTVRAGAFFRPASFDALVTDAPYGVQHGSTGPKGLRRNPLDLLQEAAPVWAGLLRGGGALGMSWNVHVAGRDDAASVLEEAGLVVKEGGPYERLRHRVDQSILRDILIATKP
jgi:hypothetical protein